jgi:flagellar protein FliO/FliZ
MTAARFAIALALAATSLTAPAWAEGDDHQAAPVASQVSTPLSLRPSKPIELAPEPQRAAAGWKVAFVLALVGGAALCLRRRAKPLKGREAELTIVRRAPLGLRSELVVVNVEGQRLLIGVTPHTIQSLAILDSDDEPRLRAADASGRGAGTSLGDRFAAMLETASRSASPTASTVAAPAPPRPMASERPALHHDDVAEQARGLIALRRAG